MLSVLGKEVGTNYISLTRIRPAIFPMASSSISARKRPVTPASSSYIRTAASILASITRPSPPMAERVYALAARDPTPRGFSWPTLHTRREESVVPGRPCKRLFLNSISSPLTVLSWTVGPGWPKGGEIDIMEQANAAVKNQMTLHTGNGCSINGATSLSSPLDTNCDVKANNNKGCGTEHESTKSYGAGFNQARGGVYAMEWTSDHIAIWFWPRRRIPANALSDNPDPATWGEPSARFRAGGDCDLDRHFREHRIVSHHFWSYSALTKLISRCNRCSTLRFAVTGPAMRGLGRRVPLKRRRAPTLSPITRRPSRRPTGRSTP